MELTELSTSNEFAIVLIEAMVNLQKDLFNNSAFCSAIYMDPRFNFRGSSYLSEENKSLAKVCNCHFHINYLSNFLLFKEHIFNTYKMVLQLRKKKVQSTIIQP